MIHKPVLSKEVIDLLQPKADENYIDCTIGQGGHAKLVLEKTAPKGKVLGIDWDPKQTENAREALKEFGERIMLVNDSYANLGEVVKRINFPDVSLILLDLGYSSWHLEDSGRGFSFQKDEMLDMRYDQENNHVTAESIVNEWPEKELEKIFENYGEERFAKRIAKKIVEARDTQRIKSTFELAEVIKEAVPSFYWRGKIHYATRTFQALRIAVNGELENIEKALPSAVALLQPGGRLAVISFHSLEDRIVKNVFNNFQKDNIVKIITKKPIMASDAEKRENPRARSAKLRVVIKL